MKRALSVVITPALVALVAACVGAEPGVPAPAPADAAPRPDSGPTPTLDDGGGPDAGPAADAGDGAAAQGCDTDAPFDTIVEVSGLGSGAGEMGIALSADERTAIVASNRQSPGTADFDLYIASRADRTAAFGPAVALAALNTGDDQRGASLSADGLTLFFHSSHAGTYDIFSSTRTSAAQPLAFGSTTPVTALNTGATEVGPSATADSKTLYFARVGGGADGIHRSTLGPAGPTSPVHVTELPTSAGCPVPTADGLGLYYCSPLAGQHRVWLAKRASPIDPFTSFTHVVELDAPGGHVSLPSWSSPDGCRLYFTSVRPGATGDADIFVASKPLRK